MTEVERHARAKEVFLEALGVEAVARAELIARRCQGDAALCADVESLLRHASGTGLDPKTSAGDVPAVREPLETGQLYAGRYRVVTLIGHGAMGDVYRAEDTTLDVPVALKILRHSSPALVERLLEEVRLARQVTHPAICRVYDVDRVGDEYFFTMELVDGEDLRSLLSRIGRLPGDKVRDIGIQICEGLAAAHEQQVLHRDLKPSNIMLDGAGAIRITDFGVAISAPTSETEPLAGTLAYMAPEQLAGEPASVRTDLYAVGLVLYEALVGAPPGARGDETREMRERDVDEPSTLLPFVDPRLESIILSLLRHDPAERPASAAEVARALRELEPRAVPQSRRRRRAWIAVAAAGIALAATAAYVGRTALRNTSLPPATELLSDLARPLSARGDAIVAVLPLRDRTGDARRADLAECIQDDLIERLSRVPGIDVIAEDSADRMGERDDPVAIGRELGASFVALGSVDAGERGVRLTMTLYDARSGAPLWTEAIDHGVTPGEVHSAEQQLVARTITAVSGSAIGADAARDEPPTRDDAAYTFYVRGRQRVPPFTAIEFRTGVADLTAAVEIDFRFADAYAALGTSYVVAAIVGWIDAASGYATARRFAGRALALDPSQDEAHVALAAVLGEYEWDWRRAEDAFRNAIRLNPSSAWAHRSYARFLSTQARFDEALAATGRAAELDPTSAPMLQGAAQRFYEARRYDRAAAIARVAIRLDPVYPYSYVTLGHVLVAQGRYEEAAERMLQAVELGGRDATSLTRLAYARTLAGDLRGADAALDEARRLGEADANERALLAIARADLGAAIATLRGAVDRHERPAVWLAVAPEFDALRTSPEFAELVARVGLAAPVGATKREAGR